jgi:hypothetical protein
MAEVSVLSAAENAIEETRARLFPIRAERWLALAFIAYLEQCGRGGGCNNFPSPPSGGGNGEGETGGSGAEQALSFMGEHVLLVAALAAIVLTLVIALTAVVLWVNSRGTFLYLDNVATGRSDVGRPWREHAERAGSYFAWTFGLALASIVIVMASLVPLGWSVFVLAKRGAAAAPIVVLAAAVLFLLLYVAGANLLAFALRHFVAPLQWYRDLSCGAALRLFAGLAVAHPLTLLGFLLLKVVYSIVLAVVGVTVGCMTCCIGFLPVVHQALLQPLFYFERRWSLEILAQMGYGPPVIARSTAGAGDEANGEPS